MRETTAAAQKDASLESAHAQMYLVRRLRGPVRRVAARDGIVPAARLLEDEALPDAADVVAAVAGAQR